MSLTDADEALRSDPPLSPPSTDHGNIGLALSGGGIRSACFSLGVLQVLHHERLLCLVDYLSTVSGGGFVGSSFSALATVGREGELVDEGAASHGCDPPAARYLRNRAKYIAPAGFVDYVGLGLKVVQGMLGHLAFVLPLVALVAVALALALPQLREFQASAADLLGRAPDTWLPLLSLGALASLLVLLLVLLVLHELLPAGLRHALERRRVALIPLLLVLLLIDLQLLFLPEDGGMPVSSSRLLAWVAVALGASVGLGLLPLPEKARRWARGGAVVGARLLVPLALVLLQLAITGWLDSGRLDPQPVTAVALGVLALVLVLLDSNRSSLHDLYRRRLVDTFLFEAEGTERDSSDPDESAESTLAPPRGLRLSEICPEPTAGRPEGERAGQQPRAQRDLSTLLDVLGGGLVSAIAWLFGGALWVFAWQASSEAPASWIESVVNSWSWLYAGLAGMLLTFVLIDVDSEPDRARARCRKRRVETKKLWLLRGTGILLAQMGGIVFFGEALVVRWGFAPTYLILVLASVAGLLLAELGIRVWLVLAPPREEPPAQAPSSPCAPYHLINCVVNLQGSADPELRERKGATFVMSRFFVGGPATGYCQTERMEELWPDLNLGTAMAASGAAVAPNMARFTSHALTQLMTVLNLRLGIWVPNPGVVDDRVQSQGFLASLDARTRLRDRLARQFDNMETPGAAVAMLFGGPVLLPVLFLLAAGAFVLSPIILLALGIVHLARRRSRRFGSEPAAIGRDGKEATTPADGYPSATGRDLQEAGISWLIRNPLAPFLAIVGRLGRRLKFSPSPYYLYREMFGRLDAEGALVNVSDGGHLENLGVLELLRRRCRLILAVDGERDPELGLGALATLLRQARVDLGVEIDLDVEPLRLSDRRSERSWIAGRIRYPAGPRQALEIGWLLYMKATLTGREEWLLREYAARVNEFPHTRTSDQQFDEDQFESYRSLGKHVAGEAVGALKLVAADRSADNLVLAVEKLYKQSGRRSRDGVAVAGA